MNTSSEQIQIVKTVIRAFLPVAENPACADDILGSVLKYVEGRTNQATTRCEVGNALAGINQETEEERLDLCIDTAHSLAWGYQHWMQGQQNEDVLDCWPAIELSQMYDRDAESAQDWIQKWRNNGGPVLPGGRMVALRCDPVWAQISAFKLPFPPFDLDSGMDVEPVSRADAEELGLISRSRRIEAGIVDLDFSAALRRRVEHYFGPEGCRQRFEKEVGQADLKALLQMAEVRLDPADADNGDAVCEAVFILERALERGFGGDLEASAKAYGLLSEAHELLHETEQAASYRSLQLETLQTWIANGVPTDGNQRARVYRQAAEIYMAIGQPHQAAHYRQLADDSRTGYSFFFEARQKVQSVGGMDAGVAKEVIPILEQSMKRGFSNNLQDEVNAYALLVAAHEAMHDTGKTKHYRTQQLTSLEAWIAKGIPTESDRRAKAYGQCAEICEQLGRLENAAAFRQLQDENRDGLSLLTEALAELKTCGKHVEREDGAKILDKLTKSAQRIPESLSERHAEIYRATGRILDAWGDTNQAIEYYEYALQKDPKIAVKGRLEVLRRRARLLTPSSARVGGGLPG